MGEIPSKLEDPTNRNYAIGAAGFLLTSSLVLYHRRKQRLNKNFMNLLLFSEPSAFSYYALAYYFMKNSNESQA